MIEPRTSPDKCAVSLVLASPDLGSFFSQVLTAMEIYPLIELHGLEPQLPLICATYKIACKGAHPKVLFETVNA